MQDSDNSVTPSVNGMFAMPSPSTPTAQAGHAHEATATSEKPASSWFGGPSASSAPAAHTPISSRPPTLPPEADTIGGSPNDQPTPVVKVLSVRGVEYGLMTFMVWFGAASLIWILVSIASGDANFDILAAPISLLLTSLPVFAYLFVRLRRAELANPALRTEPSKRRFSQLTQFVSFFVVFFNLVGLIYALVATAGGNEGMPLGETALTTLIVTLVAGGVFAYYWFDEHRAVKR